MKRTLTIIASAALSLHALLPAASLARQQPAPAGQTAATEISDSHAVFRRMMRAPAPDAEAARRADELLAKMTVEEKVGQMTQLEISMVSAGRNQEIRIDPAKLEKAVVKYGVGSIL
ncbi:MAG TPA: hypothetical protein VEQ42_00855, partial [Pyrinomonadaceae bacterium]|nr:hypothetical protein [Pyrinomonadaceae bacterium]